MKFRKKIWLVTVSMGYGHQRVAYNLRNFAFQGRLIKADSYKDIPRTDLQKWRRMRRGYEVISRFREFPLIGSLAFKLFDYFQRVPRSQPEEDKHLKPTLQLKQTYSLIKQGWGKDLIKKLDQQSRPLLSTFFIPAFMAEHHGYSGEIYCQICDADISRAWAPLEPQKSRIKYLATTKRVVERLKSYGVKKENIFLTGFPLPEFGPEVFEGRLKRLQQGSKIVLMFAVGGAGAQKEIGLQIMESLKKEIKADQIKVVLSAGIRKEVKEYFEKHINRLGLKEKIKIIFDEKIEGYFEEFNNVLEETDVLWTKPSELSFYAGLGLPIIIAPPLGSQEEANKRWLLKIGAGIEQKDPKQINKWLPELLKSGRLAQAAKNGFNIHKTNG